MKMEVLRIIQPPCHLLSGAHRSLPLLLLAATDSETKVKDKAESLIKLADNQRQRQPMVSGNG